MNNSQWITFPTQLCLILYYFCSSFLHPIKMFRLYRFVTYLFIFFANYRLAFYYNLFPKELFCVGMRGDSVSVLRFPFCSHVLVILCEILLVCCLKYQYSCFSLPFLFPSYCCSVCPYIISYIIIIIIIHSLELFTLALADVFFNGICVTASLLKSPGLFLVFWPFSTMLSFG